MLLIKSFQRGWENFPSIYASPTSVPPTVASQNQSQQNPTDEKPVEHVYNC